MTTVNFGTSKRGKRTVIHRNYEYWRKGENAQGQTQWRCCKHQVFNCKARLLTDANNVVIGDQSPDHTHSGNVSTALARAAIADMKKKMTETIATPSSSSGAVMVDLGPHVLMALPKKTSLNRVLRRHRQVVLSSGDNQQTLPPTPTNLSFHFPSKFINFLLFDSGSGDDRLIILGDRMLLGGLARSDIWLAEGTFKVVPSIFFQMYSIHFQFMNGINPAAVFCLLPNKTRATYDRLITELKNLMPSAAPKTILTDFESAAMGAFSHAFPGASITGCYFHLNQSVLRKVNELGMKNDYETDDVLRGSVRCLSALAHVPVDDVAESFDLLAEDMPEHDRMNELLSYFEHTYIRGRRLRGRGHNYGPAMFPIPMWNQYESAGDGIARTTNIVEGWHHGIQSLFMCTHPSLWLMIEGLEKDSQKQKAAFMQATTGAQEIGVKKYRDLVERVRRAVGGYGETNVLLYLRAIAHLSHN
jgi:hypothetical protein